MAGTCGCENFPGSSRYLLPGSQPRLSDMSLCRMGAAPEHGGALQAPTKAPLRECKSAASRGHLNHRPARPCSAWLSNVSRLQQWTPKPCPASNNKHPPPPPQGDDNLHPYALHLQTPPSIVFPIYFPKHGSMMPSQSKAVQDQTGKCADRANNRAQHQLEPSPQSVSASASNTPPALTSPLTARAVPYVIKVTKTGLKGLHMENSCLISRRDS
ncbi:hypothetical protein NDU88_003559 [Pleurodeles waltl]|uniref:Uncharacterized protein n=1 Tax=Pleurodeles waltl TaxID=8319 RepID=A0AAV7TP12_PLEWA|nr:hypothetical protein NDU88_003559 [Pleurodeles waltl]